MSIPAKPTLTTPPTAPVRGEDRTAFANKANAYVVFIGTNVTDLTAAIDWQNTVFTEIESAATIVESSLTTVQGLRDGVFAIANFKGTWASLTGSLNKPATVFYNDLYWVLLNNLADVTASEPGISGDWLIASKPPAFESQLFYAVDEKTSGTNGGSALGGSYSTRALNTIKVNQIAGASLASDRVTLPYGSYYFDVSAPAFNISQHKISVYNFSDSAFALIGTSELAASGGQTRSFAFGKVTIASTKVFDFRHYFNSTSGGVTGRGQSTASGDAETYTTVKIWKVG